MLHNAEIACTPPLSDPQSEAEFDSVLDALKFDLLVEIADIVISHADRVREAALGNDRDRARFHACQAARCIKSALVTIGELYAQRAA